jgi:hypothetical protein
LKKEDRKDEVTKVKEEKRRRSSEEEVIRRRMFHYFLIIILPTISILFHIDSLPNSSRHPPYVIPLSLLPLHHLFTILPPMIVITKASMNME